MGKFTYAWYDWLRVDELHEVECIDREISDHRDQLLVLKAQREQLMRRAQNRRVQGMPRG